MLLNYGHMTGLVLVLFTITIVESGTVYKTILKEGRQGSKPKVNDTVVVHYVGKLKSNGQKFDSSRDRNETFRFKFGTGAVIKGWDAGLGTMHVGERSELEIGPEDAYGETGFPPVIPERATLMFDIELLAIEPFNRAPSPPTIFVVPSPIPTTNAQATFNDIKSMVPNGNQDILQPGGQGTFTSQFNGNQRTNFQQNRDPSPQTFSTNTNPQSQAGQIQSFPGQVFSDMSGQSIQRFPEQPSTQGVNRQTGQNPSFQNVNQNQVTNNRNQGFTTQNEGFSNQNQGFATQNQGSPTQNQVFSTQNQGFTTQNQGFSNPQPNTNTHSTPGLEPQSPGLENLFPNMNRQSNGRQPTGSQGSVNNNQNLQSNNLAPQPSFTQNQGFNNNQNRQFGNVNGQTNQRLSGPGNGGIQQTQNQPGQSRFQGQNNQGFASQQQLGRPLDLRSVQVQQPQRTPSTSAGFDNQMLQRSFNTDFSNPSSIGSMRPQGGQRFDQSSTSNQFQTRNTDMQSGQRRTQQAPNQDNFNRFGGNDPSSNPRNFGGNSQFAPERDGRSRMGGVDFLAAPRRRSRFEEIPPRRTSDLQGSFRGMGQQFSTGRISGARDMPRRDMGTRGGFMMAGDPRAGPGGMGMGGMPPGMMRPGMMRPGAMIPGMPPFRGPQMSPFMRRRTRRRRI